MRLGACWLLSVIAAAAARLDFRRHLARRRSAMLRSAARSFRPRLQPLRTTPRAVPAARRSFFWSSSSSSAAAASATDLAANHVPSVAPDLLPLLFGVLLAHAAVDESDDEKTLHSPPWRVESFGDKGFGAVAARDIKRGERLISERPLCCWPNNLSADEAQRLFDAMSEPEQRAFMALAKTEGSGGVSNLDEIRARRATNGFSIPLPAADGSLMGRSVAMVFPKIARLAFSFSLVFRWFEDRADTVRRAQDQPQLVSHSELLRQLLPSRRVRTLSEMSTWLTRR